MRAIALLILMATWPEALTAATGTTRVAFVRSKEIYTANEDGSHLRRLTNDGKLKQKPKWSPDGTQIAYLTEGDMSRDPKSRAKIEITTKDGKHVGTAPVLITLSDGSEVIGMRWIDSIGWYGFDRLFVQGSASPYSSEFRTIHIRSGKMGGYIVGGLAVCSSKGWIAYWAPVFPPRKEKRLEVNGEETNRYVFPDYDALPTIHIPLVWTPDCEYVAFVDPRPPAALVLIGAEQGERKVQLPGWGFQAADLSLIKEGLLMVGATKAMIYDFRENTVSEAPKVLLQRVEQQRTERERLVLELGGESPDWFTDPPTPLPAN